MIYHLYELIFLADNNNCFYFLLDINKKVCLHCRKQTFVFFLKFYYYSSVAVASSVATSVGSSTAASSKPTGA